jgi:hypothetical protein
MLPPPAAKVLIAQAAKPAAKSAPSSMPRIFGARRAPRLTPIKPAILRTQSNDGMRNPEIFIAYAPRGAGLRCALACLEDGHDVYGWYGGPRHDTSVASRYFLLENFHANARTSYEDVDESDLHSGWSLAEARRHELAAMQDAFAHEWLFYRNEPRATAELMAYCEAELAAGELNLRFDKLARLSKLQPNWTYYSPRFERRVLRALSRYWPLEYRPHIGDVVAERAAGPRP